MLRNFMLAGAIVSALNSPIGVGAQQSKLPLPPGTYAFKPDYCKLSRQEAIMKYEGAFIDLTSTGIEYYEAICEIRNVKVSGKTVSFREVCEAEGEAVVRNTKWILTGPSGFSMGRGLNYVSCGKVIN